LAEATLLEHLILAQIGLGGAESVLRALLYFVITIFVLVTVHEFGHFIAGRIFGMRVPVFSVGMGRRIFGWNKLNGLTFGPLDPEVEVQLEDHTDYRLSLLPIGGYAKIEGMIDETQTEELSSEVQPWEFRAKPWWQKSIVISAGVTLNVLLAWAIFAGRDYSYGDDAPKTTTIGYVRLNSVSQQLGIQPGDQVVAIEGQAVHNWLDVESAAMTKYFGKDFSLTLERGGKSYSVLYRADQMGSLKDAPKQFGLDPAGLTAPKIDSVIAGGPAEKAGFKKGDSVLAVNGIPIVNASAFSDQVSSHPLKPIAIEVLRDGQHLTLNVTPDEKGLINVQNSMNFTGDKVHIDYSLGEAIGHGWGSLISSTRLTVATIKEVVTGKLAAKEALGGPVKIAQMASKSAASGFESFILFMALLSMSLALLNILPIPALDGGHLIIILIEAAIGHELSQRFKLNFQKVGVAILLSLMVFMVFNDIRGL
jgi:regulator of sigma E protease